MPQILVVDDDPHIRKLVGHFLEREGYGVLEATNGKEAMALMEREKADLAILDIMMPEMDGYELCRQLRHYYDMPLLMLTAKGESAQKVKGFEQGTDDYLVKPFDPPELIARVKALLKRYRIAVSHTLTVGQLTLNRETYECQFGDERLTLPPKEFELLFKLAGYPGKTFTRDQIIEEIWGYDFEGNERTVDVHINRLRERLPEERSAIRINTVRGLGYRLEVQQP